ncbi:MAG: HEAT repeat domain-containing protein, partial [Planctomycetes bacterium]|nr:HEAT repeat domain-containing protein [Planctomycetota bacterium]
IAAEDEKDKILGKLDKLGLERPTDGALAQGYDGELKRLSDSRKVADATLTQARDLHFKVIEALAKTTDGEAVKWLATSGLKAQSWTNRAGVAEVFGYVKNADATQGLLDCYPKERDPRVRLAVLDALAKLGEARGIPHFVKGLSDEAWQVRAAAAEGMAKLGVGAKDGIEALISAIEKEAAARTKSLMLDALRKATGDPEHIGSNIDMWKKWWKDHKEAWSGPKEGPKVASAGGGAGATKTQDDFFGIPIDSDRIVFILDISGSMEQEYERKGASAVVSGPGSGKGDQGPEPFKGTRLDAAKKELIKCLKKLNPKVQFNIIFFNTSIERWKDGLIPASPENIQAAIGYVEKQAATMQTNIWDALELAFKMAGMGLNDKQYKAGVDTIYLLSDGSPYPPDLVVGPEEIIKRAREYNKLKKLRIHTISLGDANTMLMDALARDSGGTSVKR